MLCVIVIVPFLLIRRLLLTWSTIGTGSQRSLSNNDQQRPSHDLTCVVAIFGVHGSIHWGACIRKCHQMPTPGVKSAWGSLRERIPAWGFRRGTYAVEYARPFTRCLHGSDVENEENKHRDYDRKACVNSTILKTRLCGVCPGFWSSSLKT